MADQKEFLSRLSGMPIEHGVPMRTLTTFHVGGPADYVLHVQDEAMLLRALSAAKACGVPVYLLGNGSNILVRDKGIRGLVLLLSGEAFSSFRQDGTTVEAGAGMNLTALARECLSAGLMGLEWAPGIPGTLGGACAMNAGAYGGEMKQVLRAVRVLENGEIINRAVQNGELGYRQSVYCAPERIVLRATLALAPDDGGAAARQADYTARRREKQPLSSYSAGSTFKRPEGHFAGALIEGAGLKGARIGGAQVSELHAGFIINTGGATAADILALIDHVRERVLAAYGVELALEVKILGQE